MKPSSKFYSKSLTLLLPILRMVESGNTSSQIAKSLCIHKSHVFYYIKRAKNQGYIKENERDAFKPLELTQAGKNFVAMYINQDLNDTRICRAENIRFKAPIITMPSIPVDWHKVQMNNWLQYNSEFDGTKVQINLGNTPTIEFIPNPAEGDNQGTVYLELVQHCMHVVQELEDRLSMKIGRLELSAKGEWLVYDPVAKAFSKRYGQITIDGIGKVNASKPKRIGEFEFFDPRDCADYMTMPSRLYSMERGMEEVKNTLQKVLLKIGESNNREGIY